ncbi:MAG: GSCFA domain-containing protein [Crocinitomicaceae bacterium]|jgi:hypothetical protein|nr:GSCFA domain-containing protein [Crocinitomicaceae bacterium]
MKWSLDKIDFESDWKINYGDRIQFLGSCFSEHIFQKCRKAGLSVGNSAFGTLFHPLAIANILQQAIANKPEANVLEREGVYFSWNASTVFQGESESELISKYQGEISALRNELLKAKVLFVTFGTTWGYRLKENDSFVANCHKIPNHHFEKENTALSVLIEKWTKLLSELKKLNPDLQVVFSVSPVRHIRDGVIENNRSKARLLLLCESLEQQFNSIEYLPVYEVVMDELRDYRFFEADLVHPNELVIREIWERFVSGCFSVEAQVMYKELLQLQKLMAHKPIVSNPDFERDREQKLQSFLKKYPAINWQ